MWSRIASRTAICWSSDPVSMNEKVRNKQFPSPPIPLNPLGGFRSISGPPGVTQLGPTYTNPRVEQAFRCHCSSPGLYLYWTCPVPVITTLSSPSEPKAPALLLGAFFFGGSLLLSNVCLRFRDNALVAVRCFFGLGWSPHRLLPLSLRFVFFCSELG